MKLEKNKKLYNACVIRVLYYLHDTNHIWNWAQKLNISTIGDLLSLCT